MSEEGDKRVPLLRLDPELGRGLDDNARSIAERAIGVEVEAVPAGRWRPPDEPAEAGAIGFLVLEGILIREVTVAGDRSLELLNSGDLIVPWQEDAASFAESRWHVLEPLRMAVLDRSAAAALVKLPELLGELLNRAINRSRALAVYAAIAGMPGLADRLIVLLWLLAERWGRVGPDGVWMPLGLTHQMLADIVGARRPSVTLVLGELVEGGHIRPHDEGGWLLLGEPPAADVPPSADADGERSA